MMKKIENIDELVSHLEPFQIVELRKDLKISDGESLTIEQIQEIILDTFHHNTDNLRMQIENQVTSYYSLYQIQFTEEFQDDVYYRNREWLDTLFFLFQLYQYEYIFDCLEEVLVLEIPQYIDFFKRINIFIDPYYGEKIGSLFFYENEKMINALYQKEKRSDKITNLIRNIKDDACADSGKIKLEYTGNRNNEKDKGSM